MLEASGKTVDEAVANGLAALELAKEEADITILDEGTKGFLGFGVKPARVLITEKLKRVQAAEKQQQAVRAAEPVKPQSAPVKPAPAKPQPTAATKPAPVAQASAPSESLGKPQGPATRPAKPQGNVRPPKAQPTPKPQSPAQPKEPITGEQTPLALEAKQYLEEIIARMGVAGVCVTALENENGVFLSAAGAEAGTLIGYRGETLDALQYLVALKINRGNEEYHRVTLDAENYRDKRVQTLERLARRLAGRVVKTGRKIALEPMNPYERRILHSALQNTPGVRTHSEGDEPYRRVVITPSRRQN